MNVKVKVKVSISSHSSLLVLQMPAAAEELILAFTTTLYRENINNRYYYCDNT